jgi:enoyl-[acyl-carrier-protein] reductase (NADH)
MFSARPVISTRPGPLAARAASDIAGFDALMKPVAEHAPAPRLVTTEEVGPLASSWRTGTPWR